MYHQDAVMTRSPTGSLASHPWLPALGAMALGIAALVGAHASTVAAMAATWAHTTLYQYCWAVVPTLGYLLWHNRRRLAALAPSASFLGVVAAALAAALWLAADLLDVAEGRQAAVVGSIAAIVLAAVGWRVFGRVLPFLALLALAIPTGEFLLLPLRRVTVAILEAFAAVSGLPFAKDGFTVHFGANRYVVVDACGGLPFVLIGLFLGLTFALLLYRNPARIAALALAGVVAGIVANGIRVVVIVTVDLIRGTQLDLVGHGYLQWGSLVATMILMMALFALLRPEKTPAPAIETPNLRRRRSTGPRARVAASALIATALAASAPYLVEDGAWSARAAVGAVVPAELAGWRRQDRDTDWSPAARRATSATLASYRGPLGVIDVYVATAAARRDKVTGGGVDLIGGDAWMPATRRTLEACAGDDCLTFRHIKVLRRKGEQVRHIYATHVLGPDVVASTAALRLGRAWALVQGTPVTARLLVIASEGRQGLPPGEVAALMRALADS